MAQEYCKLLSEPRKQCIDARLRPAFHDQGTGPWVDVDTLAGPQNDLTVAGGPSHRDLASENQNRRPGVLGVYRPFRAAYGGDGLRCRHLKPNSPLMLWSIDEQGLALQIDGIDFAIPVVALQRVYRAAFGDDGHAAAATQNLRRIWQLP
jgi:hypothetical protein